MDKIVSRVIRALNGTFLASARNQISAIGFIVIAGMVGFIAISWSHSNDLEKRYRLIADLKTASELLETFSTQANSANRPGGGGDRGWVRGASEAVNAKFKSIQKRAKNESLGEELAQQLQKLDETAESLKRTTSAAIFVERLGSLNQEVEKAISSLEAALDGPDINFWSYSIAWFLLIVLLVMASTLVAIRSLDASLRSVVDVVGDIADGKLSKRLELSTVQEDFRSLGERINEMAEHMEQTVKSVFAAVSHLSDSSSDLAFSYQENAAIASDQSASLTEITSTMEELSGSSVEIANHAKHVLELSNHALDETHEGANAVAEMTTKMDEIATDNRSRTNEIIELGRKSKEITKIMNIINDIADQTKLLAFNAALEASSAGEAGKRFSVVAAEIRRLADSVIESTADIESRIEETEQAIQRLVLGSEEGAKKVAQGMELSAQTSGLLDNTLNNVKSTTEATKSIVLSTQQQKTASEQVLIALKDIKYGGERSASSIEQTSQVVNRLGEMAIDLHDQLENFEVASTTNGA
ncbi:MAG: methyl-accepting chemotaxis protein [Pseudomonadota bacterium]